ncbi:MAG: serine hydrolase [Oscillospiraceae bacterium]|nr:serine hydrolase [Oscillospiraceae bacterium]
MKSRNYNFFLAIIISSAMLISTVPSVPAKAVDSFENLAAQTALLVEISTGTVLFEQNMNTRHPSDSLSKIMTLLLAVMAIDNGSVSIGDLVVMTDSANFDINTRSTTQNIRTGEEMYLLDLMYCAFVGNGNEACNLIAEHVSGNIDAFISLMNAIAVELGCKNTNFTTTHGQYNENQYTSAYDQFLIFRKALSYPLFAEIAGTYRYDTAATNRAVSRRLISSNTLFISTSKYYYRPCTAGIASATYEGGYSLVSLAESNGLSLVAVVLGSDALTNPDESVDLRNLSESMRLYEWGFSQFSWRTVLSSSDLVDKAPVTNGAGADFVNLRPQSSIVALLDNEVPLEEFVRSVTIYSVANNETLFAPISSGDILGEVTVTRNGVDYGTVLLIANTNVSLHRLEYMKMLLHDMLTATPARFLTWILFMLISSYIALILRYNNVRQKRLKEAKEVRERLREQRETDDRERSR